MTPNINREDITDLEIGMPYTGVNGLAESPLLKFLGDLRWKQISRYCGVPTKSIVNEDGQRLYATFYFTEVFFPDDTPMSYFGENDKFRIYSTLRRYGRSIIDGEYYLFPYPESLLTTKTPFNPDLNNLDHVPRIRLSNIFVHQLRGAEWLKKSRPVHVGIDLIPETMVAPNSYSISKCDSLEGMVEDNLSRDWISLTDKPIRIEYSVVPDRDLNGVGLIYFANYPQILDICEREALLGIGIDSLSEDQLDNRAIIRRKSVYYSNANRRDKLMVECGVWINNQANSEHMDNRLARRRLFIIYKMFRQSDNRLMMQSTATKVFPIN